MLLAFMSPVDFKKMSCRLVELSVKGPTGLTMADEHAPKMLQMPF